MARVLGQLPARLELVAIEGEDFGEGEGLSEAMADAAAELVVALESEVRASL